MNIAIMQPYLFPYLGYFQLIKAADTFVVYDDVNYIKGGWINRNFILSQGRKQLFTLPLQGASPNLLINQIEVCYKPEKIIKTIQQSYCKAPQFGKVFPLLENVFLQEEKNLAQFLTKGLRDVCDYLNIHPVWHISSSLNKVNALRGQDKVLNICEKLKATHYINVPGGKGLYDRKAFMQRGLELSFIQPRPIEYRQVGKSYVPNLSVIDVMMFNDQEECAALLEEYDLIDASV